MSPICCVRFNVANTVSLHQEQYWWADPWGATITFTKDNMTEDQRAVKHGPLCPNSTSKKWPKSALVIEENNPLGTSGNPILSFRGGMILFKL